MIQLNLFTKHKQIKNRFVVTEVGGWGKGRVQLGVWGYQTIIYRMDKQQDPTAQWEIYSISCNKP